MYFRTSPKLHVVAILSQQVDLTSWKRPPSCGRST
jgi:hypothetical protein